MLNQPAQLGATPRQWAYWIHHEATLAHLNLPTQDTLRLRHADAVQSLNDGQTKAKFQYTPLDYPCFENPGNIGWVIRYLRGLFRWHFFEDSCLWHAAEHRDHLTQPSPTHFVIQHIDDTIGHGVITERTLETGSFIGEYLGEINCRHLYSPTRDTTYIMEYPIPMPPGFRWSIDAARMGNFTRFINHHDEANCHIAVAYDGFIFRVIILAKQEIPAGKELRLNYGTDYWRHRQAVPR
jgi:hypothetical protein